MQDDCAFLNSPEIYYILGLKMLFSPTYFKEFLSLTHLFMSGAFMYANICVRLGVFMRFPS